MRGWLLIRAGIAVLAVIAGWLLGVLPLLPSDWQPRAPIVALIIVFVLYVTAEYLHGIAGRKETKAYRDHVSDLQAFAGSARQKVEMRQQTMIVAIDLSDPLGQAFVAHFKEVTVLIDEWNRLANGWDHVVANFATSFAAETARLKLVNSGFPSVLQGEAMGWLDIGQLTWSVQAGKVLVSLDSTWEITQVPETEQGTEHLLSSLWESLTHVRDIPAVAEWVARLRQTGDLWRPLRDSLAAIEFNHDPPGRCSLCPK